MSIFNEVQLNRPNSNTFDLSNDLKLSFRMGRLIPINQIECIPGDVHKISTASLLRMAPMLAPIMHQIKIYTHHFFVPNRLLWPNWERFITGGEDGQDVTPIPSATMATGSIIEGSIGDYLGLPVGADGSIDINLFHASAYNLIYNEYFRDQNLQTEKVYQLTDGTNSNNNTIRNVYGFYPYPRAWAHDYFTSALPWTQKGPEATIPLGNTAEVKHVDGMNPLFKRLANNTLPTGNIQSNNGAIATDLNETLYIDPFGSLHADLSTATASSIIDLRRAFKLQEFLERNARGGSRYVENILAHFGVRSSDQRLQRPEFIGGSVSQMKISEIAQTSANVDDVSSPASLYGYGIATDASRTFKYRCEEHGIILSIMSVMPKANYQQGVPKVFLKKDKFDYYWPSFAHIGEQPIENQELYVDASSATNQATFGYTPRYAEYKFALNRVAGAFKTTLNYWHLGRIFSATPNLNEQFIQCLPDTQRIFFVGDTNEHIYGNIYNKVRSKRLMPYFANPKI